MLRGRYTEQGLILPITAKPGQLSIVGNYQECDIEKVLLCSKLKLSTSGSLHQVDMSKSEKKEEMIFTKTWTADEARFLAKKLFQQYSKPSGRILFNFIVSPDGYISFSAKMQDTLRKYLISGNLYMTSKNMQELTAKSIDYTGQILLIVEELYFDKDIQL